MIVIVGSGFQELKQQIDFMLGFDFMFNTWAVLNYGKRDLESYTIIPFGTQICGLNIQSNACLLKLYFKAEHYG